MTGAKEKVEEPNVKAAFGAANRNRLINQYFADNGESDVCASEAWKHVYRLLLWTDQTTGLAHCYESDKCQPGKNWYSRSLAFHDWISTALETEPAKLAEEIDWLFLRATADLANEVVRQATKVSASAKKQLEPYVKRGFPKPGEDPELVAIVRDVLGSFLNHEPSTEQWQTLVQRIRQYLTLENKRKNLVGEGFEDVLAAVVQRTCRDPNIRVATRIPLVQIGGFNSPKRGEKPNKVDVAIIRPTMRTLVTSKWSLRADRERQFPEEFGEYVNAESDRQPFQYIFVTNEFDPARLARACEKLAANAYMFTHVVHVNTDGIRATYGQTKDDSMQRVLGHIDTGRLISLERWLAILAE